MFENIINYLINIDIRLWILFIAIIAIVYWANETK